MPPDLQPPDMPGEVGWRRCAAVDPDRYFKLWPHHCRSAVRNSAFEDQSGQAPQPEEAMSRIGKWFLCITSIFLGAFTDIFSSPALAQEDLNIRWLISRDLPEVVEIERAAWQESWTRNDFLSAMKRRNVITMIAERHDRIVGYIVYAIERSSLYILNVTVAPEERGTGVGTKLVEKLKGKLSQQRRKLAVIDVSRNNAKGIEFLENAGFRREATKGHMLRMVFGILPEDLRIEFDKMSQTSQPIGASAGAPVELPQGRSAEFQEFMRRVQSSMFEPLPADYLSMDLYSLLGVTATATPEEIRSNHLQRRARAIDLRLDGVIMRLDRAADTLMNPVTRDVYEKSSNYQSERDFWIERQREMDLAATKFGIEHGLSTQGAPIGDNCGRMPGRYIEGQ